jgi:hypothetical protein
VFGTGGVSIGDPEGIGAGNPNVYAAKWTSAAAVAAFLPAGSTPGHLTSDLVDQIETPAGVLAGQILALVLNREYSCAGVFADLGLAPSGVCYGDYVIPSSCDGKFGGLTVDQFLAVANLAVGGKVNALNPYHATLSDVNETATCLNEMLSACGGFPMLAAMGASPMVLASDNAASSEVLTQSLEMMPQQFTVNQAYPNPFTHTCNIRYGLPVGGNVTIEVFDVAGRRVSVVDAGHKPAGFHTAVWDGMNSSRERVSAGIYFYRVRFEDRVEIKKMIMMD